MTQSSASTAQLNFCASIYCLRASLVVVYNPSGYAGQLSRCSFPVPEPSAPGSKVSESECSIKQDSIAAASSTIKCGSLTQQSIPTSQGLLSTLTEPTRNRPKLILHHHSTLNRPIDPLLYPYPSPETTDPLRPHPHPHPRTQQQQKCPNP